MIRGFVGDDDKIAVYNKIDNKIESKRRSPKQVFFEWDRNTFNVHGEITDFVEKFYQFGESKFAPIYFKINNQIGPIDINAEDLFNLIFFIGVIYWRSPSMDSEVKDFISKCSSKDMLFTIRDTLNNKEASLDIYERIMNEPAFIESSRTIKAIVDYLKTDLISELEDWRIYYASSEVQLHLLGDNPVIVRDENTANIFQSELIFPLSKGKTIFHTKGKVIRELPAEHRGSIDVLIFLQSERQVCGPHASYLNSIAEIAKQYTNRRQVQLLREQVFKKFE
jgi:hypothetical protein